MSQLNYPLVRELFRFEPLTHWFKTVILICLHAPLMVLISINIKVLPGGGGITLGSPKRSADDVAHAAEESKPWSTTGIAVLVNEAKETRSIGPFLSGFGQAGSLGLSSSLLLTPSKNESSRRSGTSIYLSRYCKTCRELGRYWRHCLSVSPIVLVEIVIIVRAVARSVENLCSRIQFFQNFNVNPLRVSPQVRSKQPWNLPAEALNSTF